MAMIVAPDGTALGFDRERLERSLCRRGMDQALANEVGQRVERQLQAHRGESIPLEHLHPLVGEALYDLEAARRVNTSPHEPGFDPWWALRRLGLGAAPDGLAFVAPGATRTVYANDTGRARSITLRVAYSGRAELQLPGGRRATLEGLGREVRDVEVPAGAVVCVRGEGGPYSAVAWSVGQG